MHVYCWILPSRWISCFISFRSLTSLMDDTAYQFQDEISLLYDSFLDSMRHSGAKVIVTSIRHTLYCTLTITLWQCRSCIEGDRVFHTFLTVQQWSDLRYVSQYLDHIRRVWRFYQPEDPCSD